MRVGLKKNLNISLIRGRLSRGEEENLEVLIDTGNNLSVAADGGLPAKRLRTTKDITTEGSKGCYDDANHMTSLLQGADNARVLLDNQKSSMDFLRAISTLDESTVDRLLDDGFLPNRDEIESAIRTRKKHSLLVQKILKRMASVIKQQFESALDVWVGYRRKKPNRPVFVVVLKKPIEPSFVNGYHEQSLHTELLKSFEIVIRHENDYNAEGREIMYSKECLDKRFAEAEKETINTAIENCSHKMMGKHSNLNMIGACSVRSIKFNRNHCKIYPESCIVLYVHVKGIIPFLENPFPDKIEEIPVDVREGGFEYFAGDETHPLKIVSLIGGIDEFGHLTLTGTSGVMVDILVLWEIIPQ